ncbi:MAG: DinB family protein [Armatimonadota bacterium]
MDQREHLLILADYEKWANEQWLNFFTEAPSHPGGGQFAAKADEVMEHIIQCYWHWFNLMSGSNVELIGDRMVDMTAQHAKMRDYISTCDLDAKVQRSWPEYGTYEWKTSQLIQHALCHGSYHRGQIRALAEAHGFEDWPDTDFEAFAGTKIG